MDSAKWACARCSEFSHDLFYCSECWKVVCGKCYDEYVGVCNDCVEKLFEGRADENENARSASSSFKRSPLMCPECGVMVVVTPDGTVCCPKCGSVIEVKSILFKQNPGSTEKDEPTEENQTWRDIGLPSVAEDDMPDGYEDITHPEEDDDYGTE